MSLKPSAHMFLKLRPLLRAAAAGVDGVGPPIIRDFPDPDIGYEEQAVDDSIDVLVRYHEVEKKAGKLPSTAPI